MSTDDDKSKLQKIIETAEPADGDTEHMLAELEALAAMRRPDPSVEARYVELRTLLGARLSLEGPRYYVDPNGLKRISYATYPENIVVNEAVVNMLHERGVITDLQYELLMPRTVNKEYLKKLLVGKVFSKEQAQALVSIIPGTARIYFHGLESDEEE